MAGTKWTTPKQAALDEGRYWLARPVAERIAAMEEIRKRVYKGYGGVSERMARVFELTPERSRNKSPLSATPHAT